MKSTLDQYKENMAQAAKQAQATKEDYLKIITDQNISLEERWEIFVNAPHEFKKHDHYIIHFAIIEENLPIFTLYDDLHCDHGETVETADMVDTLCETMADYEPDNASEENDDEDEDQNTGKILYKNPNIIDQLKEEILAKNLGSFKNDW